MAGYAKPGTVDNYFGAAGSDGLYGVVWKGANGQWWHKGNSGKVMASKNRAAGFREIADPNPPKGESPVEQAEPYSYGGGGSSAAAAQAAAEAKKRAQLQAQVGQYNADHSRTGTALNAQLGNAQKEYDQTIARYNQDMASQRNKYNEQTNTNEGNLAKNKQNALLAQVQGMRGLRSAMAAVGALSGDGETLMNRAVKNALDKDVDGATSAYAQNAQTLNTAWRETEDEDRQRREDANAQYQNNRAAAEASINKERSAISRNLANAYRELGDTGQAAALDARATAEADAAARGQDKHYARILEKNVVFSPQELEQYLAGAGDLRVQIGDQGTSGLENTTAAILKQQQEEDEAKRRALGIVERA